MEREKSKIKLRQAKCKTM